MLRDKLSRLLGAEKKMAVKTTYHSVRNAAIKTLFGYDKKKLKAKLAQMGITETDAVLVHANFKPDSGFAGTPLDVVDALAEVVGTKGNLLMVSLPFRGAASDYLKKNKPFRVRKTMSMMGLITEVFRRKEAVVRSFHPTHPVLAYGKDSAWLVAGHEKCLFPCGPGSPFEKLRQVNGKILFFDVSFGAITFFHYVEDLLKDSLPFKVYQDELFSVTAYDDRDQMHTIRTYAFNKDVVRRADRLEDEMSRQNLIRRGRVGNSSIVIVNAEDVVSCQTAMVQAGNLPYDFEAGSDSFTV